jgi:hypothetical protein
MLLAWIAGMTVAIELRATKMNARERFEVRDVTAGEALEIGSRRQTSC